MGIGFLLLQAGLEARYRFFRQKDFSLFALTDASMFFPRIVGENWVISAGLGVEYAGWGIPFVWLAPSLPDYRTLGIRTILEFSFGLLPWRDAIRFNTTTGIQFRF